PTGVGSARPVAVSEELMMDARLVVSLMMAGAVLFVKDSARAEDKPAPRTYQTRLPPLVNPQPLLADHPEFVEPIRETARFEAPLLVDDADADLDVRAWRFSYNARGIIELPNRLRVAETAV